MVTVDDIPVAHTPPGGYGDTMPPPVLAGCDQPVVDGAPDLAGLWSVTSVSVGGNLGPDDHPIHTHLERVEQSRDRVVITAAGIIHDMRADGTVEHGVHDVAATDFTTPVDVVATFEDGVLVLRPIGMTGVEVRRWREGDELVWDYAGLFVARMQRSLGTIEGGAQ
jgi:hypothetical protein